MAENFLNLLNSHKCTVVKISASWCGPCKNKQFLESYCNLKKQHENNNDVSFIELDVDKNEDIISQRNLYNLKVTCVPTIKIFNNTNEINTYTGINCLENVSNDILNCINN